MMYSIDFPDMFRSSSTNLVQDNSATLSNMKLLLASWRGSLFGDPGFGSNLKRFIFEPNNVVLQDLIIDDIYVTLRTFLPQVVVKRNDIKLKSSGTTVSAVINCINKLDNEVNLYEIDLTSSDNF